MSKTFLKSAYLFLVSSMILLAGLPGKPASSSYIGKRFVTFELNNGSANRWEKLKDGGSLQYWDSLSAGCCTGGRDGDGMGNRCKLLIRLDKNSFVREIRILENGMACGVALR
ncbi:hypothetical protein [Nitratifractor sp.]